MCNYGIYFNCLKGFIYHEIELKEAEILGRGSYGFVCKAKCDEILCAAKIMHPQLVDRRDPGTTTFLRKVGEECRLLSLIRHPNVVQYLVPAVTTSHDCLFSSWNFAMKV